MVGKSSSGVSSLAAAERRRRKGGRGCGWDGIGGSGVYNKACRLQDTRPAGRYQAGPAAFGCLAAKPSLRKAGAPLSAATARVKHSVASRLAPVETPATSRGPSAVDDRRFRGEICDGRKPPFRLGPRCIGGNFFHEVEVANQSSLTTAEETRAKLARARAISRWNSRRVPARREQIAYKGRTRRCVVRTREQARRRKGGGSKEEEEEKEEEEKKGRWCGIEIGSCARRRKGKEKERANSRTRRDERGETDQQRLVEPGTRVVPGSANRHR
ncbi:hypothetical protein DBV15_09777 [Temnothorax longispinosus]|uniref:Uncharacterized protein n=1 Tax=Temnothorax longispinosus TaxID=300112 RepID=A0A4S2KND3_9HYME|nr:hypothetical protein DBV15_09777 [Temnothorax longispinosus]